MHYKVFLTLSNKAVRKRYISTYMATKEEWQKESEASPHPGLKSLCRKTKL